MAGKNTWDENPDEDLALLFQPSEVEWMVSNGFDLAIHLFESKVDFVMIYCFVDDMLGVS